MAAIRLLQVSNFRGIASMEWAPYPGFNGIVGPGDSSKTTSLDAIDLVLGTRRAAFSEADFYRLDTSQPIIIDVTVGDLPPEILDLEAYSLAIRGWDDLFEMLNDEPSDSDEPVLTLRLTVNEDCEPVWCLHSARLAASGLPRDIRGTHRALISAQRVAAAAAHHLAWGPRSVLARLSEGTTETVAILAAATKAARENFNPEGIPGLQPAICDALNRPAKGVSCRERDGKRLRL